MPNQNAEPKTAPKKRPLALAATAVALVAGSVWGYLRFGSEDGGDIQKGAATGSVRTNSGAQKETEKPNVRKSRIFEVPEAGVATDKEVTVKIPEGGFPRKRR